MNAGDFTLDVLKISARAVERLFQTLLVPSHAHRYFEMCNLPPLQIGTLLGPTFRLRDGELGDDGIVVTRRVRAQRRSDGTLITWIARSRRAGASQPAIELAYDTVVPATKP